MKIPQKGICYKTKTRTFVVKKNGVYIGTYFTLERAKLALEEWLKWRDG
jgi:hypothetical protein